MVGGRELHQFCEDIHGPRPAQTFGTPSRPSSVLLADMLDKRAGQIGPADCGKSSSRSRHAYLGDAVLERLDDADPQPSMLHVPSHAAVPAALLPDHIAAIQ